MGDVRLNFDHGEIAALAGEAELIAHTERLGRLVADAARALAPKRTGAGAESIDVWPGRDSAGVYADVGWDRQHFYMLFREFGTSTLPEAPHLEPAVDRYLTLK